MFYSHIKFQIPSFSDSLVKFAKVKDIIVFINYLWYNERRQPLSLHITERLMIRK